MKFVRPTIRKSQIDPWCRERPWLMRITALLLLLTFPIWAPIYIVVTEWEEIVTGVKEITRVLFMKVIDDLKEPPGN